METNTAKVYEIKESDEVRSHPFFLQKGVEVDRVLGSTWGECVTLQHHPPSPHYDTRLWIPVDIWEQIIRDEYAKLEKKIINSFR